ncbi:MAG: AsmA-like C-terminal domain-containing protein, partial [Desulfobulbales bacterium]|nr:AsmA-like C-terminal domain-containing protein [Desulfobulbales bacterium]
TLISTRLSDDHYNFFLPRVKIYPSWKIMLGRTDKAGKIVLENPSFHINKRAFLPRETSVRTLPEATFAILNGKLEVEETESYKDILRKDSVTISDINGTFILQPQELAIDLRGSAPVSKSINLRGSLNIPERSYTFSLAAQDIKLHKSIKAFFDGRLKPVESPAGISGTVTGRGLQHIEADIEGTLPCFAAKPLDREVLLTCGYAKLKLLKSGPLIRIDIDDLEIKDPQVNLSGRIERKLSAVKDREQPPASEPVWTIDLTGSDLDLTSIRKKSLALWPNNKVAEIVSSIVLGGKALTAAYHFSGRTADFKDLNAMIIDAEFLNADIHVPGVELNLKNASGPVRIKNSMLAGQGLSARLGNSYGRNAELLLDLGRLGRTFKLDIDIDADLAALPPILSRLVDHEGFQRELTKFTEVSGKASGSLHLGDSLAEIITRVDINKMQLSGRYDRIPRPIAIKSGALLVEPENVRWRNVAGNIGLQEFRGTSGNVTWQKGKTLLNITEMQARLEGESLHALLKETKVIPRKISTVLTAIKGKIAITRGSLYGTALDPESWQYDLALTSSELTLTSPLLPEPATTLNVRAEINREEAKIQDTEFRFLGQTFILKGQLQHNLLENWHGMIEFNGPLKTDLANWLSSKGWFPEKLRPQIPCTMEKMQVSWQGKTVAVSGLILQGQGGGRLPMVKIDYVNTPEHLQINELTFYAPGEQGRLELEFWRHSPNSLTLSWDGFVDAETIASLFQHTSFKTGTFSGAFEIGYSADRPESTRFEGLLNGENLLFKKRRNVEPVIISRVNLSGIGRQLRIIDLSLLVGSENITGLGQLAAEKDGLMLDVSLAASFLTKKSLTDLALALHDMQSVFFQEHINEEPGLQLPQGWDITGQIGFNFDTFVLGRKAKAPFDQTEPMPYTFSDVQGDMQLASDKISRTEIFSSKLCGLNFKGTWFSDDALGKKFQLQTDPDKTSHLEIVLPCLGVQQDIINGEFSLQANLLKESDKWYGGSIHIKSTKGRILRLKTLSRIFKVVNILDLFEKQVESSGKRGFPFSQMDIDTHIQANNLIFDRAIIHGEGLNLYLRGQIHLDEYDTDLTLLLAPFKTFDTMISKLPIIGQPVTGADGSMVSIPVAISGPLADPTITPLHPEAIGDAIFNIFKDTFMLPYNILKPLDKSGPDTSR